MMWNVKNFPNIINGPAYSIRLFGTLLSAGFELSSMIS